MVGKSHDVGTRLQALCMLEYGLPIAQIIADTGMSSSSVYRLRDNAIKRGYARNEGRKLLLSYVADIERPGRPKVATTEAVAQEVIRIVT